MLCSYAGMSMQLHGVQGSAFHRDAAHLADTLQPQHNLRLDAKALEGRHYGDASCRDFRESVLSVLPHRRAHPATSGGRCARAASRSAHVAEGLCAW